MSLPTSSIITAYATKFLLLLITFLKKFFHFFKHCKIAP